MNATDRQILYWAHMLDECAPLDETNRTRAQRAINTTLGGLNYGFGLPSDNEIKNKIEKFVGWADAAEMAEWVRLGYVDPNAGENDFFGEVNEKIGEMIKSYAETTKNARLRGAALAVADAPADPPKYVYDEDEDEWTCVYGDEWDYGKEQAYVEALGNRIDEIQRDNPAFKNAPEIFLVQDPERRMSKLIAVWCTDWTPNGK